MKLLARILFLLILLTAPMSIFAQLSGTIYDEKGDALPFVTVFKEGTSIGTVSNLEGKYTLNIDNGNHTIVYKYIGYEEQRLEINIDGNESKDVSLKEESIALEQVTVTADAEDPAYRVIRNAIKNREANKSKVEKYEADLYVKGVVKMLEVPEKILGQEIGDMEGMLDTTGQGIVYLGESQSKIYFHAPGMLKEEMYSSIVAEDDGSFNINRFVGSNYSIYDEYFEFGRSLLNPIADNALTYYRYKLLSAKVDKDGHIVNKIAVIPKSSVRPVLFGTLYIIEDLWTVKELDLSFTGKAIKEPVFDTVTIQQVMLPVNEDARMVFSQTMQFKLGLFGFRIGGGFTYVFSDYNLNPAWDKSIFGNEEFIMEEDAIKQDSSFWTSVRPVKLTQEEKDNYIKKDSLKKVWASKEYQDSIDRVNNKFVLGDILFGYSYANTPKKRYISYSSPLGSYSFNPVEGHRLNVGLNIVQLDSSENRRYSLNSKLGYGFADERLKYDLAFDAPTNRKYWESYSAKVGDTNVQFDDRSPVPKLIDTWVNLWQKENFAKYYRKKYVGLGYQREVWNGVFLKTNVEYANREPVQVLSDYSFRNKDQEYRSNNPIDDTAPSLFFNPNSRFLFSVASRFRIGQKYSTFPKFIIRNPSNWPDLWVYYDRAFASLGDASYDKLRLRIKKDNINFKLLGYSNFNIEAGTFLSDERIEFIDQHHFLSNRMLITLKDRYMRGYKLMPYYDYSTTNDYITGFYEHHFDGYILDLIPGIKQLGWKTVLGVNALARKDLSNYYEVSYGISDFKIKGISLFRLDYVWSFDDSSLIDHGIVIGLSTDF